MKAQICKPVAIGRLDGRRADGVSGWSSGLSYRRHVAGSRALSRTLFASSCVDLQTLVIAETIRRRAQAELQREAQREEAHAYEMPVSPGQNHDRGERIRPTVFDE